MKLETEVDLSRGLRDKSVAKQRSEFYQTLLTTWDVLAYERYKPGSQREHLSGYWVEQTFLENNNPTITLSPGQVCIINALTDAVGIPHKKRQAEIAIPEKLKHYSTWTGSEEYREQVLKANPHWRGK